MSGFAQHLNLLWADPAFWAAGVIVVLYAVVRFNQRPAGPAALVFADADPMVPARAFTTAFRYRLMQAGYAALFLLAYFVLVVIVSVPSLKAALAPLASEFNLTWFLNAKSDVAVTAWAATLLSVVLPTAPGLRRIDDDVRGHLQRLAAIPFKAHGLSRQMREFGFSFSDARLLRQLSREVGSACVIDVALKDRDSALYQFVRLKYLQLEIADLAERNPRLHAFLNEHRDSFDAVFAQVEETRAYVLQCLDASADARPGGGEAGDEPFDEEVAGLVRKRLGEAFERLTRFLACAALQASRTEDTARDLIERLGFAAPDPVRRIDPLVPLYAFLAVVAATAASSFVIWLLAQEFGLLDRCQDGDRQCADALSRMFLLFVIWGFWSGLIHTASVFCVIVVKFKLAGHQRLPAALTRASLRDRRAVSYVLVGLLSWAVSSALAYAFADVHVARDLAPVTVSVDYATLWIWGLVSATTGVCFAWRSDRPRQDRHGPLRDGLWQGTATALMTLVAAFFVLGDGDGDYAGVPVSVLWLMAPVTAFVIGFLLGAMLPSRYRLKSRRPTSRAAVIGAGVAGLACAQALMHRGFRVTVFEKQLGAGGRIGAWELDRHLFDLGAPYCTTSNEAFENRIRELIKDGQAAEWRGEHVTLRGGGIERTPDEARRYVARPTMNAISRRSGLHMGVQLDKRIDGVVRQANGRWKLRTSGGASVDEYDVVIAAVPGPEAARLLNGTGAAFLEALKTVRMFPRWVVAAAFDERLELPFDAAHIADSGILAWAARDSAKPGRPAGERWVLHADDRWNRSHADSPAEQVRHELLAEFWKVTGHRPVTPRVHRAVRWRYGGIDRALHGVRTYDARLGLGACGDWCIGSAVEYAWVSGHRLAEQVDESVLSRWFAPRSAPSTGDCVAPVETAQAAEVVPLQA